MDNRIIAQSWWVRKARRTFEHAYPETARRANGRIERAFKIATLGYVQHAHTPHSYFVSPWWGSNTLYLVSRLNHSCTCTDFKANGLCEHQIAVAFALNAQELEKRCELEIEHEYEDRRYP